MPRRILIFIPILLLLLALAGACTSQPGSKQNSEEVAQEFVEMESTFRFDGIADSLYLASTTSVSTGWEFNFEFECTHSGYGNRTGQNLLQVITPHVAMVTVSEGRVTDAIMDGKWDMVNQRLLAE